MKKLTLTLMQTLAESENLKQAFAEHSIPDDLALQFEDAKGLAPSAPPYMLKFWKEYSKPLTGGDSAPRHTKRKRLSGDWFIFTSAQNNTEIHLPFWNNLLAFAQSRNASIHVGQFTYNKSVFRNGVKDNPDQIYFAPELEPYFLTESAKIVGMDIVFSGDLNILPTNRFPLSGMEKYTGPHSTIIPHAKIALESVAVMRGQKPKQLFSTGAVTLRNYTRTTAGSKAEAEHCFGALVVRCDRENGLWFAYQLQTDETGEFCFLKECWKDGKKSTALVASINFGDLHAEHAALKGHGVLDACRIMTGLLQPEYLVFNDTLDMRSRNHHNRNDPHFLAKMLIENATVKNDLASVADIMDEYFSATSSEKVFVASNHDLALDAWLKDQHYNFRFDPVNAPLYFKLQSLVYDSIAEGKKLNLLQAGLELIGRPVKGYWLQLDQEFQIAGIDNIHGHIGVNGAKGSPKSFAKLSGPVNSGHTHSPSIHLNVWTAGVIGADDLDMGYNIGPSSWAHSHIVTYVQGFRCMYTMKQAKNGEWLF